MERLKLWWNDLILCDESEAYRQDRQNLEIKSFKCESDKIQAKAEMTERYYILEEKILRHNDRVFYISLRDKERRNLTSQIEKKNN